MITIYTSPACIQCTTTKKALNRAGIAYTEINIQNDLAAADQLRAAGHQALPVIDAGTAGTWTGFQPRQDPGPRRVSRAGRPRPLGVERSADVLSGAQPAPTQPQRAPSPPVSRCADGNPSIHHGLGGESVSAAGRADPPNPEQPCQLLTLELAQTVVPGVASPQGEHDNGTSNCYYSVASNKKSVMLMVAKDESPEKAAAELAEGRQKFLNLPSDCLKAEELPQLGSGAYRSDCTGGWVHWVEGSYELILSYHPETSHEAAWRLLGFSLRVPTSSRC